MYNNRATETDTSNCLPCVVNSSVLMCFSILFFFHAVSFSRYLIEKTNRKVHLHTPENTRTHGTNQTKTVCALNGLEQTQQQHVTYTTCGQSHFFLLTRAIRNSVIYYIVFHRRRFLCVNRSRVILNRTSAVSRCEKKKPPLSV